MRVVIILFALFPLIATSESICFEWFGGFEAHGSLGDVCAEKSSQDFNYFAGTGDFMPSSLNDVAYCSRTFIPRPGANCSNAFNNCVETTQNDVVQVGARSIPGGCQPGPCETLASLNPEIIMSGSSVANGCTGPKPGAPNGCRAVPITNGPRIKMGDSFTWSSNLDGSQCSAGGSSSNKESGNCTIKGGVQMCLTKQDGKNCGTYNGDRVCVNVVPAGSCQTYSSGGMACVSAPTPPAPDNGTEGQSAVPSMTVTENNVTVNYFNNTTVNNSASPSTGAGGGKAGEANPTKDGESSGSSSSGASGSASGGDTCSASPSCSGDSVQCAQLMQSWRNRCTSDTDITASQLGFSASSSLSSSSIDVAGSLDTSGFLGGSQCIEDMHVDLDFFGVIDVPLSQMCFIFQLLGFAIVACAGIAAAKIIVGANSEAVT